MARALEVLVLAGALAAGPVASAQTLDPDVTDDGVVDVSDVSWLGRCIGESPLPSPIAVAITSPADGALVTTPSIGVRGTVGDPDAAVTVAGVAASAAAGAFESTPVPLVEGENLLEVFATAGAPRPATPVTWMATATSISAISAW